LAQERDGIAEPVPPSVASAGKGFHPPVEPAPEPQRAPGSIARAGASGARRTLGEVAKPLEEWTVEELRAELVRLGEELARRAITPARKQKADVARACEGWVRGYAWDETFTPAMVEDEFSLHERKTGQTLPSADRERLLHLWRALFAERHRDAA